MFGKNLIAALILATAAFFLVVPLDSELLSGLAVFLALAGGGAALALRRFYREDVAEWRC